MIAWVGFLIGIGLAAAGTTVVTAAGAVGRLELTRWISRRLRGAAVASTLFAAPGRVRRTASAIGAVGGLVAGLSAAALFPFLTAGQTSVILVIIGTPVVAVLAYGVPHALGERWPEKVMGRATPWIASVSGVLKPFIAIGDSHSPDDYGDVLLTGSTRDQLEPAEIRVISGVRMFTERMVREVMTPRTEIIALLEGASLQEVARVFTECGYSRLPVYSENLDNIIGMVHAFDLLQLPPGGELPIRPVLETPGSRACAKLLLEMQRERRQLAVVLDEFGGTAGIVTLHDLVEELVGEIFDEGDVPPLTDGWGPEAVEYDGTAATGDVAARFDVSLQGEVESIGGWLAKEVGRIPRPGERVTVQGIEFDVLRASPTRVERIAARRVPANSIVLRRP